MEAAIAAAKQSIGQFLKAFVRPAKNQKSFLVKAAFIEGQQQEHIWLADLDFKSKPPRGVVGNEPALPGIKFMQVVEFHPSQITDWMYIEDGYLVGGYTTRVIRKLMSPEERIAYDERAPYKFRADP